MTTTATLRLSRLRGQLAPCPPLLGFALLLLTCVLVGLCIGQFPLGPGQILRLLASQLGLSAPAELDADLQCVLWDIRLPRVLVALLVGGALACAGSAYQAVFRNPLVSPSLLGVQSGAAVGAASAMLLGQGWLTVQLLAFLGGLAAVGLAVLLCRLFGRQSLITLLLGGMISSALFGSMLAIIKYVADPYSVLPSIVYWMMGSLAQADGHQVLLFAPPMLVCMLLLCLAGRWLDALAMGDEEAQTLGVPVLRVRYGVIVLSTLLSAMTVSLAGTIGWIGVVVPHMIRMLQGPNNGRLLPASCLFGASFLILADGLARVATSSELPIGIVTELLGIPAFVLVLRHARRGW